MPKKKSAKSGKKAATKSQRKSTRKPVSKAKASKAAKRKSQVKKKTAVKRTLRASSSVTKKATVKKKAVAKKPARRKRVTTTQTEVTIVPIVVAEVQLQEPVEAPTLEEIDVVDADLIDGAEDALMSDDSDLDMEDFDSGAHGGDEDEPD